MRNWMITLVGGDGLKARAVRGAALTFSGFSGQQALRLAGNLVLTRVLFPEAFGLMALVQVLLVGLAMFSDLGTNTSIMQNKRGDDPEFLNTAWTVQVLRGVVLWLVACALAVPMANFYDAPQLASLVPVAALSAVIAGLQSTNIATANRNILLGRLTGLALGTQAFGLLVTIALALWLQSVWALIIGTLISGIINTALSHVVLPGIRNRFGWDKSAFSELFHFGKYLFLSTVAGFLVSNADRAILGKYVSLDDLAIYNIAFFLANVPLMLSQQLVNKIMLPLYRERPPAESPENARRISKVRYLVTGSLVLMACVIAISGDAVIDLLYDDRYSQSGPILVLLGIAFIPSIIPNSYGSLLLAQGRSRSFAILMVASGVIKLIVIFLSVSTYGLIGVVFGLFLSSILVYPVTARIIYKSGGWDWKHDLVFTLLVPIIAGIALWINYEAIVTFVNAQP